MSWQDIPSIQRNLQAASSTSKFEGRLWMWFADEDSQWGPFRWGRWVKRLANKRVPVPVGLTLASISGIHTLGKPRHKTQASRWLAAFGNRILPTELLRRLNDGLWTPNALRIFISQALNINFTIVINDGEAPVAVARRVMSSRKREAFHHRMVTDKPYQGRRLTGKLMANTIPVYEELGITAVKLVAGLSAGTKVWPKFGFRPIDELQWKKMHRTIRKNVEQLDNQFRKAFEDETGERIESFVENFLKKADPKDIWLLSALDDNWSYPATSRQGLGSFLLQKTRWKGILKLDDAAARAILDWRIKKSKELGPLQ